MHNGLMECSHPNILSDVMTERTSFALDASAFESSGLVISLYQPSDQKVAYIFVAFKWNYRRCKKRVPVANHFEVI